jgi:hypothetical protein
MLVDGMDFCIPQKGAARKGNSFGLHKYVGKSTLCYELGVDILMGDLIWIQGPYPAGAWPDIKIFTSCLMHFFKPGKRVEANDGYGRHVDKVKCPKNDVNPVENLKMQGCIRARHKMLNGWLKNWGILSQVYYHNIRHHGDIFWTCAVITQLTIKNGKLLFEVEYGDETLIHSYTLFILNTMVILSIQCIQVIIKIILVDNIMMMRGWREAGTSYGGKPPNPSASVFKMSELDLAII